MNEIIEHLRTRRSVPAVNLIEPIPSSEEISTILQIATRVPDHGKLAPWRFILFQGDSRIEIGRKQLLSLLQNRGEVLTEEQQQLELTRLSRAPLVIGVVSRAAEHPKIPVWEQQLSAGAVCNQYFTFCSCIRLRQDSGFRNGICLIAEAGKLLGINENEQFAGFIHIGTPAVSPVERDRPNIQSLVSYWSRLEKLF